MKSTFASLTAASLLLVGANASAEPTPPEGFTALFNGKDLSGWHGLKLHPVGPYQLAEMSDQERAEYIEKSTADAKEHWSVENEELVNDGKGAYLATDQDFGDYELLIDYKTVPKADSGIYLRMTPQVQIWDYTDESKFRLGADKGSGGLWNNSPGAPGKDPAVLADKPFGEWNSFRIIHVGERVTIFLNGKKVVDHARLENYWDRKRPLPATGPIVLQTHGGEIRWRNIFLREIGAEEANEILSKHDDGGFEKVFNGEDLSGWAGAVDSYEVRDGAIVCKPGKGGNIQTQNEYADFVARLEYKLPPGGNNGLAIRYPGTQDAAYNAMCEVQILDDTAPKYSNLDPRQFNGSAYGMVAAHTGFLRPVGEWNFMEVTVKGPTIRVELNGTQILDADLSQVTEYMANRPHPGKDRTSGYFGFCGHNDPVAFRDVRIKTLGGESSGE